MTTIRLNDEGTTIRATIYDETNTASSISGAISKYFVFRRPDGTTFDKSGVYYTDGTDGILSYTVISGDINLTGRWEIAANVRLSTGQWTSTNGEFFVEASA